LLKEKGVNVMNALPRLMESADFSPFFKSTVGFDRLMRMLEDDAPRYANSNSYPPYNIEQLDENDYRIDMAVAGFSMEDIDITVQDGRLIIEGSKAKDARQDNKKYLYRGIANRNFAQEFKLADHIEVKEATLENGMLSIALERIIPEEKKPRKIEINYGETKMQDAKKLTKKAS
jgi:molecular chaperone IbpA